MTTTELPAPARDAQQILGELWLWALARKVHYGAQAQRYTTAGADEAAACMRARQGVVCELIEIMEGE